MAKTTREYNKLIQKWKTTNSKLNRQSPGGTDWQKPPGKTLHENQCQHTQGSETMGGRACIRAQFPHRADRQQTEEVQKHMGVMPPQTN